ncbi:NAD-dependent epimerase/dehydratase family protein [Chloroflexota bacterium]
MAVLITGAGLIGCQAAHQLVERGETPVLFDSAPQINNIGKIVDIAKIKIVTGDVSESLELMGIIEKEKIDRIIHTAALMTIAMTERPATVIRANIMGMVNILEAARIFGLKRIVFTSSSTVYRSALPYPKTELLSEDFSTMFSSGRPIWMYATTKLACEQLGFNYLDTYHVDLVVVRFVGVFGPWVTAVSGTTGKVMREITEKFLTEPGVVLDKNFTWSGKSNFLYSKDAAYSTILACFVDNPKSRIYNIAMSKSYSLADVVKFLKEINPQVVVEIKEVIEGYFGPTPQQLTPTLDIAKARSELGYKPQYEMASALEDYTQWLKANLS